MKKLKFSIPSLIVALLLSITMIILMQFATNDLSESLFGKKPEFVYTRQVTSDLMDPTKENLEIKKRDNAWENYKEDELIPYQTKQLFPRVIIYSVLFILAVLLKKKPGKISTAKKLTVGAFFFATAFNLLTVLINLAGYIYRINQQIAIYGISIALIMLFIWIINYIQKK